jgi:hypothetical protein
MVAVPGDTNWGPCGVSRNFPRPPAAKLIGPAVASGTQRMEASKVNATPEVDN